MKMYEKRYYLVIEIGFVLHVPSESEERFRLVRGQCYFLIRFFALLRMTSETRSHVVITISIYLSILQDLLLDFNSTERRRNGEHFISMYQF